MSPGAAGPGTAGRRRWLGRARRVAGAFALLVVVLAAGSWAWLRVQDVRLRRAFALALEEAETPSPAPSVVPDGDTVRVSVVTYNVWALPVALPGMDRLGRLPRIPEALAGYGADLILLQEAFDVRVKPFFTDYFRAYAAGPLAHCREAMKPWGVKDCTGGLLTLSRYPIREETFYVHVANEESKLDERQGRKGFMVTTVETALGPVDVVNIHLYAGRTAADEAQRVLQLRQLADVIGPEDGATRPALLVGDLNVVHPTLSAAVDSLAASEAYRFLLDSLGFVDTRPEITEADYTYDVEANPYADVWYNRFEGRQVFDYALTRGGGGLVARLLERRRILDGDDPLSDHFGLYVVVELAPERPVSHDLAQGILR